MVERDGKKRWIRTRVILEDHMTVSCVGDDVQSPDRYVEDYVRDLTGTSLDTSRPLWEFHIINTRTSEAEAVVILKLHHSLGDGVSLIRLLLACTRKTSDPHAFPTLPVPKKERSRTPTTLVHAAWSVCRLLWNTFIDVLMFIATVMFLSDTNTPLRYVHCDAGATSPKRIVHRTFSMDDLCTVKHAMDATVNDVVVGMTQAGISRYLDRRGYGLDSKARFRSVVIVNLRPPTDMQDMHEMMRKGEFRWGNMIGYVLLPMSVAPKDDPLDYVREAKVAVDRRKMSLESRLTYATVTSLLSMLGERAVVRMTRNVLRNTSMSFSNVVGPDEEVDFCGHTLAYLAPSVCGHPHALTVHFQSYVGKMTVVVTADETVIPDPHELCADLVASLQHIKASL